MEHLHVAGLDAFGVQYDFEVADIALKVAAVPIQFRQFCCRVWQARHQEQCHRVMNTDLVQADFQGRIRWQIRMRLAFLRTGAPRVRVGCPVLAAGDDSGVIVIVIVVPSTM